MISRTSRWRYLLNWHFTPVQKRLGRRLQPEVLGVPVYLILVTTLEVRVILLLGVMDYFSASLFQTANLGV